MHERPKRVYKRMYRAPHRRRASCDSTPKIGETVSKVARMSPSDGSEITEAARPSEPTNIVATRWRHWATGLFFALCWFFFAVANLQTFILSGKPSPLVFGIAETLIATFFILRVPPRRVSQKLSEWIVAGIGTFLPLLLRATIDETNWPAEALLLFGSLLQVAAIVSINRSFALVPALRELKTDGAYRFVRHPVYASYVVSLAGFLWANYSNENLLVIVISLAFMIWRIRLEEALLEQTLEYRQYRDAVRWRLLPGIW